MTVQSFLHTIDGISTWVGKAASWLIIALMTVVCVEVFKRYILNAPTAWIFDAARQFGPEAASEVARWAAKLERSGVVAFGMGGDELAHGAAHFRAAFDLARAAGLRIVCHAGEIGGAQAVREAIEILGAERIGHGIAVMHDAALAESLSRRKVFLENCLSSNLATGALAIHEAMLMPGLPPRPSSLTEGNVKLAALVVSTGAWLVAGSKYSRPWKMSPAGEMELSPLMSFSFWSIW